jgi:hypothetical protein
MVADSTPLCMDVLISRGDCGMNVVRFCRGISLSSSSMRLWGQILKHVEIMDCLLKDCLLAIRLPVEHNFILRTSKICIQESQKNQVALTGIRTGDVWETDTLTYEGACLPASSK